MEPDTNSTPKARWYEAEEEVALSVEMIVGFPASHKTLMGSILSRLADKHCQASHLLQNPRTLPPEKVLSLFKAKNKARSYDKIESVHHAMNCLFVLPEAERSRVATEVITVVDHIMEYFAICQYTHQPVDTAILQGIADSFIADTLKDTVTHLSTFYPSMTLPNGPTLQSIRTQLQQNRARAYADEMASWRQSLGEPEKAKAPAVKSEAESTPPARKDETVTLQNRDMKIRLDKLDL
ncbi:hypothetical protein [Vampirovibrio chlorellavorus]|uniref:hypothetical protein n=1 Tax=Vampirovibrio chlorellavorus TaxID=758823 RepID=UPI0026EF9B48|nr:hypothetical protein [Vampirovibrio chlorellavorus]